MPGLVPDIHALQQKIGKGVDGRAFAAPKRLRLRRRDKPGHDEAVADESADLLRQHRLAAVQCGGQIARLSDRADQHRLGAAAEFGLLGW